MEAAAAREDAVCSCPICLDERVPRSRQAIVISCMHVFCADCLVTWARQKRSCPLCKGRIQGYLYDIEGDDDYKERWIPESPPPSAPYQYGSSSSGIRSVSAWVSEESLSWRRAGRHRERQQQQQRPNPYGGRPSRWDEQPGRAGGTVGGGGGGGGAVEPRPYFWRVQAHMTSGLGSSSRATGAVMPVQPPPLSEQQLALQGGIDLSASPALTRRRLLYTSNLWAMPLSVRAASRQPPATGLRASGGGAGGSSAPAAAVAYNERHLEAWVERELQALLLERDVTIVRAFVMGLVRSFGVHHPERWTAAAAAAAHGAPPPPPAQHEQQQPSERAPGVAAAAAAAGPSTAAAAGTAAGSSGGGGGRFSAAPRRTTDPVQALSDFLFGHAAHFWHELCTFAASGLNMAAFDQAVTYPALPTAAEEAAAAEQQPEVPDAPHAEASDRSGSGSSTNIGRTSSPSARSSPGSGGTGGGSGQPLLQRRQQAVADDSEAGPSSSEPPGWRQQEQREQPPLSLQEEDVAAAARPSAPGSTGHLDTGLDTREAASPDSEADSDRRDSQSRRKRRRWRRRRSRSRNRSSRQRSRSRSGDRRRRHRRRSVSRQQRSASPPGGSGEDDTGAGQPESDQGRCTLLSCQHRTLAPRARPPDSETNQNGGGGGGGGSGGGRVISERERWQMWDGANPADILTLQL